MTSTLTRPVPTPNSTGADLTHLTCCVDDTALCGTSVGDYSFVLDDPDCVVCIDLYETDQPCGPTCPITPEGIL